MNTVIITYVAMAIYEFIFTPRTELLISPAGLFLCVCVFIYVFMCVTSPGQTKNDTDLKFGTHTPIDLI